MSYLGSGDNQLHLLTSGQNYTLGARFCDPHQERFQECFHHFATLSNISLVLPLSRYLSDQRVTVDFANLGSGVMVHCPSEELMVPPLCHGTDASSVAPLVPLILANGQVQLDVTTTMQSSWKLRYALRRDVARVCELPNDLVGIMYKEFNFKIFRVCHE